MIINKLTIGQKKITIFYAEGKDDKILTSGEKQGLNSMTPWACLPRTTRFPWPSSGEKNRIPC